MEKGRIPHLVHIFRETETPFNGKDSEKLR